MANQVVVELSAEDASMVAAWQRAKDNISQFEEKIKSTKGHSKGWTDEMKRALPALVALFRERWSASRPSRKGPNTWWTSTGINGRSCGRLSPKQLKSRQELTQMLALSGNLKQAPAVERALEEIDTATKDEKLAVFRSVSQAAPGLERHKQTELVKEIAPLAEILGTEGAGEVGQIAGTPVKVARHKSMAELANLAHMAMSHAGGRGAELGDEGSLRALQIFQKRLGMSVERASRSNRRHCRRGFKAATSKRSVRRSTRTRACRSLPRT